MQRLGGTPVGGSPEQSAGSFEDSINNRNRRHSTGAAFSPSSSLPASSPAAATGPSSFSSTSVSSSPLTSFTPSFPAPPSSKTSSASSVSSAKNVVSSSVGNNEQRKAIPEAVSSYGAVLSTLSGLLEVLSDPSQLELEELQEEEIQRLLKECEQALAARSGATGGHSGTSSSSSSSGNTNNHTTMTKKHPSIKENPNDIKVLIVDDEEVAARLMSNQLAQLKIRNEWVLSGKDALNRLYASPEEFDLVLCDVNMPGLSGSDVLVRILKQKQIRDIPIVMVSTDDDLDKAKELVSAGAKDYIVKPVTQIALVSMSLKVNGWRQESSTRHLKAVYDITSGLLVNVRLILDPKPGEQLPDLPQSVGPGETSSGLLSDIDTDDVLVQNLISSMSADQVEITKGVVQEASLPMCNLLGVSKSAIQQGSINIFDFIAEEDRATLKQQLKESIFAQNDERPHERKMLWRWLDINQSELPVVGSWIRVGPAAERQVLIESSSLLPTLMLKREKEMRADAERKKQEAEQGRDSARAEAKAAAMESQRLKADLSVTKKTATSVQRELNSMLGILPDFHKMLNENPHVLTWRIEVATGKIDFVSKTSCLQILHYTDTEVVGHNNSDFLHPDDAELVRSSFQDTKKAVRIRRFNKEGDTVWLESRPYAWWDTACSIVIVTEYDITRFHGIGESVTENH
mmetsp:Transcript_14842/g.28744  ORF Transcript_14842/g.28744 Transcript_14842/m.28744 type:complete len:687 (+) Transcript_14842:96-2156(+)